MWCRIESSGSRFKRGTVLLLNGILLFAVHLDAQPRFTIEQLLSTRWQQVQGGGIAKGAILYDGDRFGGSFNRGVVALVKGQSHALVDPLGNTVVDFNTYRTIATTAPSVVDNRMVHNGLFSVSGVNLLGHIDQKGKLVVRSASDIMTRDKMHFANTVQKPHIYTAAGGQAYRTGLRFDDVISEGIGVDRYDQGNAEKAVKTYMRLNGEKIFSDRLTEASPFSDGMALVSKRDEYGVLKYGFIDGRGRLAIPFQFTVRPSHFYNGLARVQPANTQGFEYGFINRKGDLIFRQTREEVGRNGRFSHFANGISHSTGRVIMDTTFTMIPNDRFMERLGLKGYSLALPDHLRAEQEVPILLFSKDGREGMNRFNPNVRDYGFINLRTGRIVMPCFYLDGTNDMFVFDPVSRLARARVIVGRQANGQPQFRDGFINEDGQFAVMLDEKAVW